MQAMWTPSEAQIDSALVSRFMHDISESEREKGISEPLKSFQRLYQWSLDQPECFWSRMWDFAGVKGDKGEQILADGEQMPGARWFPEAQLNFAENLLRPGDHSEAIVFRGEDKVTQRWSHDQLYCAVVSLASVLKEMDVKPGDRVAGVLPNMPQTIIAALASSAIGAVWTSASPDFGSEGLIDRFSQTRPKILLGVNGYYYNGKSHNVQNKLQQLLAAVDSIERFILIDYVTEGCSDDVKTAGRAEERVCPSDGREPDTRGPDTREIAHYHFDTLLQDYHDAELEFPRFAFDHPLYVMYSSGTTGKPKCIVHGAGGTLLQHLKEHQLHCDIRPGDRVFYFSTCGWMMWNWLVTALASDATLMLYDGSPFYPDGHVLFNYAEQEHFSFFGTSAKYIDALAKAGLKPGQDHDLSTLRTLASTGSVLAPESFDYVYSAVKADLNLASISGGTDIISCFMLGSPIQPVYRGQIQTRGLGMAVDVFDAEGQPVQGERGELVCTRPFPSMPVAFWNDTDGSRYHKAYFDRFNGIWCHGDFVELTAEQGLVVYGRSDATLNPGGVRIGTAEIYRQVDTLDQVLQSVAVGQNHDNDVRVLLFVQLREGLSLNELLTEQIKNRIREGCTPRHVPALVIQVEDIPRTLSGKLSELAVRDAVNGYAVHNRDALANPESLDFYLNWKDQRCIHNHSN